MTKKNVEEPNESTQKTENFASEPKKKNGITF